MFNTGISTKPAFGTVKWTIYLLLMSLGVFFIYQGEVWERFENRRTNFAIYTQPIDELPTITTDIPGHELKLGVDFNLTFQSLKSGATNATKQPTILTKSGIYPVSAEENYEPFKIEFETDLYGSHVFKITPVVDPTVKLKHIGDLAVTYSFDNASVLKSEESVINLALTTENNSIVGSYLIGKWKSYDGLRASINAKWERHLG